MKDDIHRHTIYVTKHMEHLIFFLVFWANIDKESTVYLSKGAEEKAFLFYVNIKIKKDKQMRQIYILAISQKKQNKQRNRLNKNKRDIKQENRKK